MSRNRKIYHHGWQIKFNKETDLFEIKGPHESDFEGGFETIGHAKRFVDEHVENALDAIEDLEEQLFIAQENGDDDEIERIDQKIQDIEDTI